MMALFTKQGYLEVYNWLNAYAIDDVFDNSHTRQGEETLHTNGSKKCSFARFDWSLFLLGLPPMN